MSQLPSTSTMYRAFERKDPSYEGVFWLGVRTTGIFCRPTCPARKPLPRNVEYFPSAQAALAAGYRPCKRCRPNEASLAERQQDAVARACRLIEEADETPSLTELADTVGMSRYHFHRVFKMFTGVTPKVYAAAKRAQRDETAAEKRYSRRAHRRPPRLRRRLRRVHDRCARLRRRRDHGEHGERRDRDGRARVADHHALLPRRAIRRGRRDDVLARVDGDRDAPLPLGDLCAVACDDEPRSTRRAGDGHRDAQELRLERLRARFASG